MAVEEVIKQKILRWRWEDEKRWAGMSERAVICVPKDGPVVGWGLGRPERIVHDSLGGTKAKAMRTGIGGRHLFTLGDEESEENVP